ncbi:MAG: type II toxin-antitoxin system VapC family toxin [Bacteroidales bacterium]|jgi:predicted nucleic acid-binding protein|nr:type II toxin-antitoxin system VapC family toxin [Bacteroidales bacterium]
MAKELIICDTDVLIDYFDKNQIRHQSTKNIIDNRISLDNVVISAITKMELLLGASNKTEIVLIDKFVKRFGLLFLNDKISEKAIKLILSYRLSHGLAIADSLIAATSIITQLELFTYNSKDFRFIKGLQLFDFQ